MSAGASIRLSNVRRIYEGAPALEDVSLTAPDGQVLALLGASGSGKSTILRLIAGLEAVDGGEIWIGETRASAPGSTVAPEARRIGLVFQDFALFPHLTVAANIGFGLDGAAREARAQIVRDWLARVGLLRRAGAYPHELSGGEQQRVALARALAPSPRAILLDEPFSGLDPVLRAELREATLDAIEVSRATAIFVTHDAEEALVVADRLAILKNGRVLQEAAPREAYDRPASADAAAALGPINLHHGEVSEGHIVTPFGAVAAPTLANAAQAIAAVRAEALLLCPGAGVRVVDRRPHGAHDLVRIESEGAVWRALVAPTLRLGERADAAIDPRGAFAFAD